MLRPSNQLGREQRCNVLASARWVRRSGSTRSEASCLAASSACVELLGGRNFSASGPTYGGPRLMQRKAPTDLKKMMTETNHAEVVGGGEKPRNSDVCKLEPMASRAASSAWSSRHAWAAHNPAIEKTVEPSTAGVRRRIVSTDKRRRQDIRERLYGLDSPHGTLDLQHQRHPGRLRRPPGAGRDGRDGPRSYFSRSWGE